MFKIKLLNKQTNQVFEKVYNSYYIFNKELTKYKHSTKLQVLSTDK